MSEVHDELTAGVLEERDAPSISRPGYFYKMVRTASGWQHANTDCTGWLIRQDCHHVKELDMETSLVPSNGNVLALIDELEDSEIVDALSGAVTRSWIYEFPVAGQTVRGISAVGVEEAAGEMAKHGEAIRVIDVRIEHEDDFEARFLVQAGRYAISADGREALLDVTIRGKRQSKTMTRRDGKKVEDESWYEKGITKAVRNAKLALLPEYAKTHILAEAVKAGRVRQVAAPQRPVQAPTRPSPPAPPKPDPDATVCEHEAFFDEKSTLMTCKKCGVILEEAPPGSSNAQQTTLRV